MQWYLLEKGLWFVIAIQAAITLFVLTSFSMTTCMDPGIIPKGEEMCYVIVLSMIKDVKN